MIQKISKLTIPYLSHRIINLILYFCYIKLNIRYHLLVMYDTGNSITVEEKYV
jgi:fucose 4-O-acetylase-like acetyltransferase